MRDVIIADRRIPARSDIVVMLAAANHDETKSSDPERFDVLPHSGGRAGFGMGVHHCLGAHLGCLEARVALEWLVPCLPRLERVSETVTWNDNWFVRGPQALQLVWKST